ncbi:MAG: rhomboid family intramembrane serine protease, partial [Muribaculaceae bacterium]|nr:rhomboid family intramembrane serine protease [Muribaculaceae bacterium]
IGYGVIEFFLGVAGKDMVAHFAHLGGMLFGIIILLYWKKKGILRGGSFY